MRTVQVKEPKPTEAYPGLNDITDAFEAFPSEIVKYFTLYKEIDAKYIAQIPLLCHRIEQFKRTPKTQDNLEKRLKLIKEVSELLTRILPCMEEKMHVASIAADKTVKHVDRINDDFDLIVKGEIPDSVRFGQINHPAIINDSKVPENKSAQSQRSESRREALAAKKAANETDNDDGVTSTSGRGKNRRDKESTPASGATSTTTKKRKTTNGNNNSAPAATNSNIPLDPVVSNTLPSAQVALSIPASIQASLVPNQTSALKNEDLAAQRPGTPTGKRNRTATKKKLEEDFYIDAEGQKRNSAGEIVYCYCNQVSYGEMVGCDGDDCKREWFHLPCTGLATLPRGKWYCDDCKLKRAKK
jgi:hypothetical protein